MNVMRHHNNPLPLTLVLGLGLLACAEEEPTPEPGYQPSVATEVNPEVDFSQYVSFDVIDPEVYAEGEVPSEYAEFKTDIESAVIAELTSKGLTHDTDNPQLLVNPFISTTKANDVQSFYTSYWGWYYGYNYQWTVNFDYVEGSLVLDVVDQRDPEDVADDLLVYRGVAVGLLSEDEEVVKLQIRNATHELFADWPE